MTNYFSDNLSFNLSNIFPAEESIAFQTKSKFCDKLTETFRKGYEIKAKEYNPVIRNVKVTCMKISDYVEPLIKKIFKDELGLLVEKIYFNYEVPNGFIAINFYNFDEYAVYYTQEISRGVKANSAKWSKNMLERIEEVRKIASKLDTNTGKLNYSKGWPIELYIDLVAFYFLEEFRNVNKKISGIDDNYNMLPEEMTAIITHEAGHAIMFLEKAIQTYALQLEVDDAIKKFVSSNPTISQMKQFGEKYILEPINEIIDKISSNKVAAQAIGTAKTCIENVCALIDFIECKKENTAYKTKYTNTAMYAKLSNFDNNENMQDSIPEYLLVLFMKLCICAIVTTQAIWSFNMRLANIPLLLRVRNTPILIYNLVCLWTYVIAHIDESEKVTATMDYKTSDLMLTRHNTYQIERLADEFVIRQGYGKYLGTGLHKMISGLMYGNFTQNKLVRNSKLIYMISIITYLSIDISRRGLPHATYEKDHFRIKRMIQDTIAAFKDSNLPNEFKNAKLEDIKTLEKLLKENYGTTVYDSETFTNKVLNILVYLINPETIVRMLITGNLHHDYEKHFNKLEDLVNNMLYVRSHELKNLASKF